MVVRLLPRDQVGIRPDRLAVGAPVQRKGPARQGFARIPLALAVVEEAVRREALAQLADQRVGLLALGRADRGSVPLLRFEIVDRHESRLAAHRQPNVLPLQHRIDLLAERVERVPGFVGERLGDARMLGDPVDAHLEAEIDIGEARHAGDRRGIAIMRRRRQRHMAFACQQAGGRVEPDPARAGDIDLAPGMQVGEVDRGARRPVERDKIGLQLDQVARDEARGDAEIAERLHQQPARIAARAFAGGQRLLRRHDAGLHADDVADLALHLRVQRDDEVDRVRMRAVDAFEKCLEQRPGRLRRAVDFQVVADVLRVVERKTFRRWFDEEVERVIDRHVGDQIDLDLQLGHRFWKDEAREEVAVGVLLHVDEVVLRLDLERVAKHLGARMRRGLQPDHLRAEHNRPVVFVVRQVIDGCENCHFGLESPVPSGFQEFFTGRRLSPSAYCSAAWNDAAGRGVDRLSRQEQSASVRRTDGGQSKASCGYGLLPDCIISVKLNFDERYRADVGLA